MNIFQEVKAGSYGVFYGALARAITNIDEPRNNISSIMDVPGETMAVIKKQPRMAVNQMVSYPMAAIDEMGKQEEMGEDKKSPGNIFKLSQLSRDTLFSMSKETCRERLEAAHQDNQRFGLMNKA